MSSEGNDSVVLDLGSGYMKCGFGGDEAPRSIFKNLIGTVKKDAVGVLTGNSKDQELFVGEDAVANSAILELTYCIDDGVVANWEGFEACVSHVFETELRCNPELFNVLLTEAPCNPQVKRNKMYEVMFETFKVKGSQCQVQAVLSLYASGRTTGMVVDSGDGVTHTVPVYKGFGVRSAVGTTKLAGRKISRRVVECLNNYHGKDFTANDNSLEIAKDIKEKICKLALDYEAESKAFDEDASLAVEYVFPDGSSEVLTKTIIEPAELLYRPKDWGEQKNSIPEIIDKTIQNCDITMRMDMFGNTVCSGGTTCTTGFLERLEKEYKNIVPDRSRSAVKVDMPLDRKFAVFAGGSILCGLSSFADSWITKEEYEERGVDAIQAKNLF